MTLYTVGDRHNPPVITENPEDTEVTIFEEVNISCKAQGEPNPTYSWFKVCYIHTIIVYTSEFPSHLPNSPMANKK